MAEVPFAYRSKRIVHRHVDIGLYPAPAFLLSTMITHFPVAIVGDFIFATALYFLAGFSLNDSGLRYAFWVFVLTCHDLALSTMFRTLAYLLPSAELAQSMAGASTGTLLILGGFLITYDQLPKYMWPLYWFSPFSWTVRSLAVSDRSVACACSRSSFNRVLILNHHYPPTHDTHRR